MCALRDVGRLTAPPAQPPKTTEKSGRSRIGRTLSRGQVAERQGFEPWVGLHPQRFSRPPRSTTPAPLRVTRWLVALFRRRKGYWGKISGRWHGSLTASGGPSAISVRRAGCARGGGFHSAGLGLCQTGTGFCLTGRRGPGQVQDRRRRAPLGAHPRGLAGRTPAATEPAPARPPHPERTAKCCDWC